MKIHDVAMTFFDPATHHTHDIRWFAAGETAAQARAAAYAAVQRECAHEIRGMDLVGKVFSKEVLGRSTPGQRKRLTSGDMIKRDRASGRWPAMPGAPCMNEVLASFNIGPMRHGRR